MRAMWSMHPFGSSMPQFLRLPPRIANPLVPGHRGYSEGDLAEDATAKIKGFRDALLEKENIELKKQLDDISKNNSKQMHS